tara:strand:+ start:162 stop:1190 length:1029 start_codon:yes stop_codon:yes gene_type:complete
MLLNKINIYLFIQICKYFFLVLFIFLSVAWLLQITRLFTITNFMHIKIFDVIILSFYLIPNIISVITPFILIFGLLLCFIKLNKDNELIAMLSLGVGLKPFRNTLFFFTLILTILFSSLNSYLAPKIYKQYKIQEYDLRNKIDFKNISFSNFLNLNKTTILDFKKKDNEYLDILISYNDDKENIIYAKKGNIFSKNNKYNFQLTNGFKISIDRDKQIEKLEFLNYLLKIENKNISNGEIVDKNTFTILDDFKNRDSLNISLKITDVILIFLIIYLFYINNIKQINFNSRNNIYFCILCISILIINQILRNSEIFFLNYLIIISSIIIFSILISLLKKKYEEN